MSADKRIANLTAAAMFVALITLAGTISIPVPPIPSPVNFVDMFVIMAGLLLGFKYGLAVIVAYIVMGAVGVPIFSGLTGGWGILLTARGGFIFSFLPAVALCGLVADRRKLTLQTTAITAALAYIIIFTGGAVFARYLAAPNIPTWDSTVMMMVVPFMPGTILKFGVILLLQRQFRVFRDLLR